MVPQCFSEFPLDDAVKKRHRGEVQQGRLLLQMNLQALNCRRWIPQYGKNLREDLAGLNEAFTTARLCPPDAGPQGGVGLKGADLHDKSAKSHEVVVVTVTRLRRNHLVAQGVCLALVRVAEVDLNWLVFNCIPLQRKYQSDVGHLTAEDLEKRLGFLLDDAWLHPLKVLELAGIAALRHVFGMLRIGREQTIGAANAQADLPDLKLRHVRCSRGAVL
mmetsp:Transcript_117151/g.373138  ORF Transcript_117151/g.373138 Transcript_117151/m.373138 type:complete len:218 (+) Transcript_117151:253-906(+)